MQCYKMCLRLYLIRIFIKSYYRIKYGLVFITFLQRDVMKLLQINDEMVFFRFLCAAAGQTGKMINYAELAKAAEISAPTAKQWIKTLEAAA